MTTFEFVHRFPYRPLGAHLPSPALPIRLKLGDHVADIVVLVDTGAERTLLDGMHVRAAGFDLFQGAEVPFYGFLGSRMTAYGHQAKMEIAGLSLDTEIAFSTQPLSRQVLGRDLLEPFILAIREGYLELYLTES